MSNNKTDLKVIHAKLTKIAQDELALGNKLEEEASAPSEAGPQEVVDAVAEIAADIESVLTMIPAEPSSDSSDEGDASEALGDAAEAPVDPEKEQMVAKLAALEKTIDTQAKERIAQSIADHYGGSEAKYAEIMADSNDSKYWAAQEATIVDFAQTMKLNQNKVAQTGSSYVKVAQLSGKDGMKNLML